MDRQLTLLNAYLDSIKHANEDFKEVLLTEKNRLEHEISSIKHDINTGEKNRDRNGEKYDKIMEQILDVAECLLNLQYATMKDLRDHNQFELGVIDEPR